MSCLTQKYAKQECRLTLRSLVRVFDIIPQAVEAVWFYVYSKPRIEHKRPQRFERKRFFVWWLSSLQNNLKERFSMVFHTNRTNLTQFHWRVNMSSVKTIVQIKLNQGSAVKRGRSSTVSGTRSAVFISLPGFNLTFGTKVSRPSPKTETMLLCSPFTTA